MQAKSESFQSPMTVRVLSLVCILLFSRWNNISRLIYFFRFTIIGIIYLSNITILFYPVLVFLIYVGGIMTLLLYVISNETNPSESTSRNWLPLLLVCFLPIFEMGNKVFTPDRGRSFFSAYSSLILILAIMILIRLFFFQPLLRGSIRRR